MAEGTPPNRDEVDTEARQLRKDLIEQFGPKNFACGALLAKVANTIHALYHMSDRGAEANKFLISGSIALSHLMSILVEEKSDVKAILTVARSIDSAVDQWMTDDIVRDVELHSGLPPFPKI